jgi:hypothetical protein
VTYEVIGGPSSPAIGIRYDIDDTWYRRTLLQSEGQTTVKTIKGPALAIEYKALDLGFLRSGARI